MRCLPWVLQDPTLPCHTDFDWLLAPSLEVKKNTLLFLDRRADSWTGKTAIARRAVMLAMRSETERRISQNRHGAFWAKDGPRQRNRGFLLGLQCCLSAHSNRDGPLWTLSSRKDRDLKTDRTLCKWDLLCQPKIAATRVHWMWASYLDSLQTRKKRLAGAALRREGGWKSA